MTQSGRRCPDQWPRPGAISAGRTSGEEVRPRSMCARFLSLLLRPKPPPLALGVVVAASFIAVEIPIVYLLKLTSPGNACGIFFLLGVLVVSTLWGFGLAVTTSVASAVAFAYLCSWPAPFLWVEPENLVNIATFLVVALSASSLAYLARARAVEADERRRDAEATASSSPRLAAGLSQRPMTPDAGWNAICTTAHNSGWSRWGSRSARRRLPCPLICIR